MCTHQKPVFNRYIHQTLFAKCGKCPACQQEKANARKRKIRANFKSGDIALFVTLTYRNNYLPYIKFSELQTFIENLYSRDVSDKELSYYLPVYRSWTGRYKRYGKSHKTKFIAENKEEVISYLQYNDENFEFLSTDNLRIARGMQDAVSIPVYKDVVDFLKRLRQNLQRTYNYRGNFSYYSCSELGPTTHRAHFHLLFFIPFEAEKIFRHAIVKSWPYCNRSRLRRYIEVSKDAASYVSSYVNCGSDFPVLFKDNQIKPRCSYSKGFGLADKQFSLDSIQKKVESGTLEYNISVLTGNGFSDISILMPKYVINRYYPKFKGLSRLSLSETSGLIAYPASFAGYKKILDLSSSQLHSIKVMLDNAFKLWCRDSGLDPVESYQARWFYAQEYCRTWKVYNRTLLRIFYLEYNTSQPLLNYDNWYVPLIMQGCAQQGSLLYNKCNPFWINFVVSEVEKSPSMLHLMSPNLYPQNISRSCNLEAEFYSKYKRRKVTNVAMSELGHDV